MKTKKNGAIELLRILAASLLVLHLHQQGTKIDFLPIAFYGGKFDFGQVVELFFLISGYLMYKHIDGIQGNISLVEFGKKRIIRLYPMLFITVLVEFILHKISSAVVGGASYVYGIFDLLVNSFGLQQLGIYNTKAINQPTWYLSVLLYCYFLFFLVTKVSKNKNADPFVVYSLIVVFSSAIITYGWNTLFLNSSIGRGLFAFFLGVLLGKYLDSVKKTRIERCIIILPVLFVLLIWRKPGWVQTGQNFLYTIMMWIPLLIFAVRWNPERLSKNETIAMLGAASFSVYLWNEPLTCLRGILVKTQGLHVGTIGFLICFFVINWYAGIASYYYLEIPINQWIHNRMKKDTDAEAITFIESSDN